MAPKPSSIDIIRNGNNTHAARTEADTMLHILCGTDTVVHIIPIRSIVVTLEEDGLQCNFTKDVTAFRHSDVLLLNVVTLLNRTGLPSYRPPGQRWVAYSRESPYHTPTDFPQGTFNHTMTYAPFSDIPMLYGECTESINYSLTNTQVDYAAGKRHLVAWFVSNCGGQSGRFWFVGLLQKYIPIHIYGDCGDRTCPDDECDTMLSKNYKFYLAFENSLCRWYLTEKVFRAYEAIVVPVVFGAIDYREHLPKGSYLHMADYESPAALARHMLKLDANDTLYNEMFKWRTKYHCESITSSQQERRICNFLHKSKAGGPHTVDFADHFSLDKHCKKRLPYIKELGFLKTRNDTL